MKTTSCLGVNPNQTIGGTHVFFFTVRRQPRKSHLSPENADERGGGGGGGRHFSFKHGIGVSSYMYDHPLWQASKQQQKRSTQHRRAHMEKRVLISVNNHTTPQSWGEGGIWYYVPPPPIDAHAYASLTLIAALPLSSVASFLVWGGGGGQDPQMYRHNFFLHAQSCLGEFVPTFTFKKW